ncbi:MAG: M64 family metallopeptidase [Candidatus Kapaibacterium sp.]
MKTAILLSLMMLLASSFSKAAYFDQYFKEKTLRIDYHHTGHQEVEYISIDKIYSYGMWAGSRKHLKDNFNNGAYYYKVYDKKSGNLIFSKGFDSYFREYRNSDRGSRGILKTYHETALIPEPKDEVIFAVELRDKFNKLNEIFRMDIDPASIDIIREEPPISGIIIEESMISGNPSIKVDIAVIGEGYTSDESPKFKKDMERFTQAFFRNEPFKSNRDNFNIYGVLKPSAESGVDEPRAGIYKNTSLNASFNSLGSERYLLTEDNKALRDIASAVPYDALLIMINSPRYGGGGIYNFYCTFTSDNQWFDYLIIHEFGHSFAGLADEYYTSDVAFDDFYPKGTEPVEPNITALNDPAKLKWKDMLTPGIEIPSEWNKKEFDSFDLQWQKKRRAMNDEIARLKKSGASNDEIIKKTVEYDRLDREHSIEVNKMLSADPAAGKVGAFEGAGYASTGLFRPMTDCIMFSKGTKPFCKVCQKAIEKVIGHYTE